MTFRELFQYRIITVSNFLTLSRVLLIPFFWHYTEKSLINETYRYWALGIALLMIATDFFDGFIARALGQQTPIGQYLDPLADKLGVIAALFLFYKTKDLPCWFLLFVLLRELLGFFFGSFLLFRRNTLGKPNYWGKFGVFFLSINFLFYLMDWEWKKYTLFLTAVILTGGIIRYTRTYWKTVFLPSRNDIK